MFTNKNSGCFLGSAVLLLALCSLSASAATRNVREFGAAGNGQDDDTAAIQKAIRAAAGGDEVFFPAGTYRLTASLTLTKDSVSLVGEGRKSILRAAKSDFSLVQVEADKAAFRKLAFEGAATNEKPRQFAIFTNEKHPAEHGTVQQCFFSGPDKTTGLNCGIKLDTKCNAWKIEDCRFERLIGATAGSGYGVLVGNASDNQILKNRFNGEPTTIPQGRHAVYLSGGASNNHVIGNIIRKFNQSSIAIYARQAQPPCKGNEVKENQIFDQGLGATGSAGIELSGFVMQNHIEGNRIEEPGRNGIIVSDAQEGGRAKDNVLVGNQIIRAGQFGILLEGAQGTDVRDNIIHDASVASPGTYSAIQVQAKASREYSQAAESNTCSGNEISGQDGAPHYRWAIMLNETAPAPNNTSISKNSVKAGMRGSINTTAGRKTVLGDNNILP